MIPAIDFVYFFYLFLLFFFFVPFAAGDPGTGTLNEVRISDCSRLPCVLRKGTKATIEIDYVPSKWSVSGPIYYIIISHTGPIP